MKAFRPVVVCAMTGVLIFAGAGAASASVTKSGTKNCSGTTAQSWLKSKTSGSSVGYAPGWNQLHPLGRYSYESLRLRDHRRRKLEGHRHRWHH